MIHETLDAPPAPAGIARRPAARLVFGALAVGLAAYFAWADPARNAWPAAALVGAFAIDGVGRLARRPPMPAGPARRSAPPSAILATEAVLAGAALLFAVAVLLVGEAFAVLASLFAGLLAMGGIARLAITRAILAAEAGADDGEG